MTKKKGQKRRKEKHDDMADVGGVSQATRMNCPIDL